MGATCLYVDQAGKSSASSDNPAIAESDMLDDGGAAATRNRFVVVDDRLRGDEELAIAILEKAVLGETVLDRVVLEQLKAYIRGGGGSDQDMGVDGGAVLPAEGVMDGVVRDLDNLSVSSSEEGDKYEDACGDVSGADTTVTQSDRLEKHASVPQKQRTMLTADLPAPVVTRTPAEGLDAGAALAQAKLKDRPITKGEQCINSHVTKASYRMYRVCQLIKMHSTHSRIKCVLSSSISYFVDCCFQHKMFNTTKLLNPTVSFVELIMHK